MNTPTTDNRSATERTQVRRLRRSRDERMLGGVAGGIARYINADVMLVRVIFVAVALFTGVGAVLYLAAWLLIPAEGDDESIATTWIDHHEDQSRR